MAHRPSGRPSTLAWGDSGCTSRGTAVGDAVMRSASSRSPSSCTCDETKSARGREGDDVLEAALVGSITRALARTGVATRIVS